MKTLITYSSLTGNTKKVAEAIFEAIKGEKELLLVRDIKNVDDYDKIIVGYWVDKGEANAEMKKFMETIKNKEVGTFGTLGAYPDSEHALNCVAKIKNALEVNNNKVTAEFICQGAVDPKLLERMAKMGDKGHHKDTPERRARLAEAAKHPNEDDFNRAKKVFENF